MWAASAPGNFHSEHGAAGKMAKFSMGKSRKMMIHQELSTIFGHRNKQKHFQTSLNTKCPPFIASLFREIQGPNGICLNMVRAHGFVKVFCDLSFALRLGG